MRLPSAIHSHENTGAKSTIIIALTDCHHDEAKVQPKRRLSVLRSANEARVDRRVSIRLGSGQIGARVDEVEP